MTRKNSIESFNVFISPDHHLAHTKVFVPPIHQKRFVAFPCSSFSWYRQTFWPDLFCPPHILYIKTEPSNFFKICNWPLTKVTFPFHFQCETQHLIFGNWISVLGYCQYISSAQILKILSRFSPLSIVVYSLSSKQPIFSASCQLLCLLSNRLRAPLVHENYLAFIAKTFRPKI